MDAEDVVVHYADAAEWGLADNQIGAVETWADGEAVSYVATAAVTLTDDECSEFRAWVARAVNQLIETGDPHANGWYPSRLRPGHWYLTCGVYPDPMFG